MPGVKPFSSGVERVEFVNELLEMVARRIASGELNEEIASEIKYLATLNDLVEVIKYSVKPEDFLRRSLVPTKTFLALLAREGLLSPGLVQSPLPVDAGKIDAYRV